MFWIILQKLLDNKMTVACRKHLRQATVICGSCSTENRRKTYCFYQVCDKIKSTRPVTSAMPITPSWSQSAALRSIPWASLFRM